MLVNKMFLKTGKGTLVGSFKMNPSEMTYLTAIKL